MPLKPVRTDKAPAAIGPYSQGIIANGFLFCAGQIALDPASGQVVPGDVKAQTERAMHNLTGVLAAAGCSWRHVVKTTVYLADMNDFPAMNDVYGRMLHLAPLTYVHQRHATGALPAHLIRALRRLSRQVGSGRPVESTRRVAESF